MKPTEEERKIVKDNFEIMVEASKNIKDILNKYKFKYNIGMVDYGISWLSSLVNKFLK